MDQGRRVALQDIVSRRIDEERRLAKLIKTPSSMTDFSSLPGAKEIKIHRSAGKLMGLANPFFRVHEGRAGATTHIAGQKYLNFSSYDYLGLNGHAEVNEAVTEAVARYGTSCSASRLVAGERPIHSELERNLAAHYGQQDSVAFVSGHGTNVSVIGALLGPRDLVVHDSLAHNSIVIGATLSGATRRAFPHNDVEALDRMLSSCRALYERVLIVAEGLYSMDGDCADLAALVDVKVRHGAWLMIDEAHSLGTLGAKGLGTFEQSDVKQGDVDIWMGTMSKTLASCGGYVAGCSALIEYLKYTAGGFVYSVGVSPPIAAASLAALRIFRREPARVADLQRNSALFWNHARARKLDVGSSEGHAIIPILTQNSLLAVSLSQTLFERGINVQPIIHPAVPERNARLRFFISSAHTPEDITSTVDAVADCLEDVSLLMPSTRQRGPS